jgi:hypothetical protein
MDPAWGSATYKMGSQRFAADFKCLTAIQPLSHHLPVILLIRLGMSIADKQDAINHEKSRITGGNAGIGEDKASIIP